MTTVSPLRFGFFLFSTPDISAPGISPTLAQAHHKISHIRQHKSETRQAKKKKTTREDEQHSERVVVHVSAQLLLDSRG